MINTLRSDLRKCLFSLPFLLSAVLLMILIFSTPCVIINTNTPNYPIALFILKTDRTLWEQYLQYSNVLMFDKGFANMWLGVFMPFLVSFPCVPVFCDEYNSNCWRHCVERTGRRKYILSKFICVIAVAFALITLCYLIYAAICMSIFPDPENTLDPLLAERGGKWYEYYYFNNYFDTPSKPLIIAARIITSAVVASVNGLFALALSAVTMNKYTSMGIPMIIYFFFMQFAESYEFGTNIEGIVDTRFFFADNSQRISGVENWFCEYMGQPLWWAYLYFALAAAALFVIYRFFMMRRLRQ